MVKGSGEIKWMVGWYPSPVCSGGGRPLLSPVVAFRGCRPGTTKVSHLHSRVSPSLQSMCMKVIIVDGNS